MFPEPAEINGIRAVPTVIIGEHDQLVGIISEELLVDRLVNKIEVSAFHPDTFKRIVKEGDAIKLAGMMIEDCALYTGALELLTDPDWSVRMGMMVVLEEVAERNSKLVQQAFSHLLKLLDHEEANLRGDAAYLLGRIGNASVLSRLEVTKADENSEVAEAAQEAIQQIRERQASSMD
jgi:HEAT repeat protein